MEGTRCDFFLGATAPGGFCGHYAQLVRDPTWDVTLLKGSPGCGKSTLLRRVAEQLRACGHNVEAIHCGADPASLDAVVCAETRFCLVDATAPHVLEPVYPVAYENVLTLYNALDRNLLAAQRAEIMEQFRSYKALTERVARYVTAAGSLLQDTARTAQCFTDCTKARAFGVSLSRRYLPGSGSGAAEEVRLLSAVTCDGVVCFTDTIRTLADTVVVFDDPYGCAAKEILYALREQALSRGWFVISCYCSMNPYEKLEHLLVPALRLAFVTHSPWHPMPFPGQRIVHCSRFQSKEGEAMRRKRLRFNKKATAELLSQAIVLHGEAKRCHDALEAYYKNAMDFSALDAALEKLRINGCLK